MKWFAKVFGYVGPAAALFGQIIPGNTGRILTGVGAVLTGGAIHAASKVSD